MARVAVRGGVCTAQRLCAAVQLQTQSPGDTATTARLNTTTQVERSGLKEKNDQAAHYMGLCGSGSRCRCRSEGTPVVNQERAEKGGVMVETERVSPPAPAALHSSSPRTEGIKSSAEERSGAKLR